MRLGRSKRAKVMRRCFVANSKTDRSKIKDRVIKNDLIPYLCSECGLGDEWNGKKLVLHLDHINGVNNDHRLINLRFLCPNCHSQTETYCRNGIKQKAYKCVDCRIEVGKGAKRCNQCHLQHIHENQKHPAKIEWPQTSEITKLVDDIGFRALGKRLGVSDNAIRKRIRNHPDD
jgi:RNA polymerase subunit RPABC4/transcription elongation factor Spt4